MPLTDTAIRNLKSIEKPTKHSDGLHILVRVQGAKLWKMAYRFNGKQKRQSHLGLIRPNKQGKRKLLPGLMLKTLLGYHLFVSLIVMQVVKDS